MSEILHWIYRIWRLLLHVLSWVATLLVLVVTIGLLVFQLPAVKQFLLQKALDQVNDSIQGNVHAQRLSGFPPLSLQVYDLTLSGDGETPIVSIPEVRVQLDLTELLTGTISIRSFRAKEPQVNAHFSRDTKTFDLVEALTAKKGTRENGYGVTSDTSIVSSSPKIQQQLYIPDFSIENGTILLVNSDNQGFTDSLLTEQLFVSLFFEATDERRIVDLIDLTASFPHNRQSLQMSGQLFQDEETTELNGFRIRTFGSELDLNARIDIGLTEPLFLLGEAGSWLDRNFQLTTDRVVLDTDELTALGLPIPAGQFPEKVELELELNAEGDLAYLDGLELYTGNSQLRLNGEVNRKKWSKGLDLTLESFSLDPDDFPEGSAFQKAGKMIGANRLTGTFSSIAGSEVSGKETFKGRLSLFQPHPSLILDVNLSTLDEWSSFQTTVNTTLDSLQWTLAPLLSAQSEWISITDDTPSVWDQILEKISDGSLVSGRILTEFSIRNQQLKDLEIVGNISDNRIGTVDLGGLSFRVNSLGDTLRYEADGGSEAFQFTTRGHLPLTEFKAPLLFQWWSPEILFAYRSGEPIYWNQLTTITDVQLSRILPSVFPKQNRFSLLFQSTLEAGFPEYGSGSGHVLIHDIEMNGKKVNDISTMMDLENKADSESRFTLRSSLGSLEFNGQISPLSLVTLTQNIGQSFAEKINEQTFGIVNLPVNQRALGRSQPAKRYSETILDGEYNIHLTDLEALNQLRESTPLESYFVSKGSLSATPNEIQIKSRFSDSLIVTKELRISGLEGSLDLLYYPKKGISIQNEIVVELSADSLKSRTFQIEEIETNLSILREDVALTIETAKSPDLTHLQFSALLELNRDDLNLEILSLQAGKGAYDWSLTNPAGLTYARGDVISFRSLQLTNQDQSFEINGTFSQAPGDSVQVRLEGINLGEISDFIPGRLTFDGSIAGELTGSFPSGIPVVYGELGVQGFELNNRTVGDFSLSSHYETEMERFNLQARLVTEGTETEQVNGQNERIGQDFLIEGFVRNPVFTTPDLPTFDLTAQFNRIDLWILEELLPNIIVSSRGVATGTARFRDPVEEGEEARPLLEGDIDVLNAELTPLFLNTRYAVTGKVLYSNRTGFRFNPLVLRESSGGEALLTGIAALTSLDAPIPLALSLQMNRFQFINNPYNPDLPFYATVNGTGRLDLTGNSANPVLRTPAPVVVTSNSRVSVPLLDVINVSQDNKFITFVDDFESWERAGAGGAVRPRTGGSATFAPEPAEFSFTDQFSMDLQFVAREPLRFEMIFDRITNEAIYGNGTGQMRVTLQDGNYQLFGALDLSSGEYNFVSGDILTRRFQLEEGGRIVWDGDPTNAQLNVNAVYRARPPLATLGVVSASSADQLGTGQRIPIELVLQIFGSIDEIQNEFFFRLPSGITGFSDPTLSTRISSLNRNQEEKLVQAFSILLTGNFIPSGESTFENTSVLSGLTGSAVLINPFVSTQLLSPLLSNQINSLLNENVTFDVDVNIDAYNEVELAVALRLYNDRLVLRREGQITGDQNRLGDLGATYQINRILSLTAFHRQDPTFTSNTGQSAAEGGNNQVINGAGVEARFQFHTWKEFFRRLTAWLR